MRKIQLMIYLVLSVSIVTACAVSKVSQPETGSKDQPVARVGAETIKKAEYKQELDSTYQRFHQTGQMIDGSMFEQLKKEILESLINLVVLDQYSKKLGIVVDETLVEKHYQKAVAAYSSISKFKKALHDSGLTESDLRARLRRTLAAQEVVKTRVAPQVEVTDEEVKAYYEENAFEFEHDIQVHAAHILIKIKPFPNDKDRQEARGRILELQKKIKAGEDFATLAKTYSEGPSKVSGGDLGYFGSAQMAPAFETAAFSLKPGEVSEVVTTQFGYHLIKVYDRKPAGKESLSEAAPLIKNRFYMERHNKILGQLVEKLKSETNIERLPLD